MKIKLPEKILSGKGLAVAAYRAHLTPDISLAQSAPQFHGFGIGSRARAEIRRA